MPSNPLRQLVSDLDRERARPNRLTGDSVLPPRSATSARRVCGSCWQPADQAEWQAAYQRWRDDRPHCEFYDDWTPECYGHWQEKRGTWLVHRYERAYDKCPRCGGVLHEVQA